MRTAIPSSVLPSASDIDGNFTINAANGAELEVSYLGYEPKTVTAHGTNLEVKMSQNTQALNEVVVTALGIKKEAKALSYNVQQLNSDDITGVKDANFMNALAGRSQAAPQVSVVALRS